MLSLDYWPLSYYYDRRERRSKSRCDRSIPGKWMEKLLRSLLHEVRLIAPSLESLVYNLANLLGKARPTFPKESACSLTIE